MRFQFEMTEDEARELEGLLEAARSRGVKTKKEVVNYALSLLDWAITERQAGRIIASVDEKNKRFKEVVMPIFPKVD